MQLMTRAFGVSLLAGVLSISVDALMSHFDCPLLMHSAAYAQGTSDLGLNAQLLVSARNDDFQTVRRVLDSGALPDARNRAGDTALMIFVRKGNAQMVEFMLAKDASANLPNLSQVASYARKLCMT